MLLTETETQNDRSKKKWWCSMINTWKMYICNWLYFKVESALLFRNMVVFVTYISLSNASLQLYSINENWSSYCKLTFICVPENFIDLTRILSWIWLNTNQSFNINRFVFYWKKRFGWYETPSSINCEIKLSQVKIGF